MSDDEKEVDSNANEEPAEESAHTREFKGQLKLPGNTFDNYAAGDSVMAKGQIIFTSPVTTTPKCSIRFKGQIVMSETSQQMLGPATKEMTGQLILYPDGVVPRLIMGEDTLNQAFLEAMTDREILITLGRLRFASDVKSETLKEKIHSIACIGQVLCSESLHPHVLLLCRDKIGEIEIE